MWVEDNSIDFGGVGRKESAKTGPFDVFSEMI